MTISIGSIGSVVQSGGPVIVAPERLLSFSKIQLAGLPSSANVRYRFRINPERLSIRHDVIEKYVLSKAGYERQDWGNGLSTFQYVGTTGVFKPDVSASVYAELFPNGIDIRQTNAYRRFKEFEQFYRTNRQQNVFMYYQEYDHEWEGSLSGFSFDKSAGKPFHLDYQFTFTGMPIDYPSTQAVISVTSQNSAAVQQRLAGGALGDFSGSPTSGVG